MDDLYTKLKVYEFIAKAIARVIGIAILVYV